MWWSRSKSNVEEQKFQYFWISPGRPMCTLSRNLVNHSTIFVFSIIIIIIVIIIIKEGCRIYRRIRGTMGNTIKSRCLGTSNTWLRGEGKGEGVVRDVEVRLKKIFCKKAYFATVHRKTFWENWVIWWLRTSEMWLISQDDDTRGNTQIFGKFGDFAEK